MFSFILHSSHRSRSATRHELEALLHERTCWHSLHRLKSRWAHAVLGALWSLRVRPNFFDLLEIFFCCVGGFTIRVHEGHPIRNLLHILLWDATASHLLLAAGPARARLSRRVECRRRRCVHSGDATCKAASVVRASVGSNRFSFLRGRICNWRAHYAQRVPGERIFERLALAAVTCELSAEFII